MPCADSGTSINAQACRGQVEGAALQAFGQSLFEELRYDGTEPANATPLSYRVPLAGAWGPGLCEAGDGGGGRLDGGGGPAERAVATTEGEVEGGGGAPTVGGNNLLSIAEARSAAALASTTART